jgi:amidase
VSGAPAHAQTIVGELRAAARLPAPREPAGWPAARLRDAIAARALSAVEVVSAHLERLAEVQPWLNAATSVRADAALAEAAAADRRVAAGEPAGVLCGVPISVKDVIAVAGVESACASAAFAGNVPSVDAVAVARLRAAGAIVMVKANCPEFAFGITCESARHGVTRSPWGDHSPGGSSGGDAALVAAGAVAIGLGTDYGGSVRWPAASCGVVGLRPGVGAVDGTGQLPGRGGRLDGAAGAGGSSALEPLQRRLQVVGPLARSLTELRLALGILSGGRAGPAEVPNVARVGVVPIVDGEPNAEPVSSALRAAAGVLAASGVEVQELPGALDGLHAAYNAVRATDPLADLRAALAGREGRVGPVARAILAAAPLPAPAGSATPAADAAADAAAEAELAARVAEARARVAGTPVLLAPVAPSVACDLEGRARVARKVLSGFELMGACRAVSALGVPAVAVPVGVDPSGLPLAVQVVAGPGGEGAALAVAGLLEAALGSGPRPPWLER